MTESHLLWELNEAQAEAMEASHSQPSANAQSAKFFLTSTDYRRWVFRWEKLKGLFVDCKVIIFQMVQLYFKIFEFVPTRIR